MCREHVPHVDSPGAVVTGRFCSFLCFASPLPHSSCTEGPVLSRGYGWPVRFTDVFAGLHPAHPAFFSSHQCHLLRSPLLVSTALHSTGRYRAPLYWSVQLSTLLVSMALHFIHQYSSPLNWSIKSRVSTLLVTTALHSTCQYSNPLYWSVQLSSLLVGTAHNQTLLC